MSDAAFLADLADLFDRTVTVEPVTSREAVGGKPTYGTAATYAARILMKAVAIRTTDGTTVVGRGRVLLLTAAAIDRQARLTLPADFPPRMPPILMVRLVDDESGSSYTELVIG